MEEIALVIELKGSYAKVRINHKNECDGCTICKNKKPFELTVFNEINASIGDEVIISVDKMPALMPALTYISPIITMLIAYLLSMAIFKNEHIALMATFLFLFIHIFMLALFFKKKKYRAMIIEVYKASNAS